MKMRWASGVRAAGVVAGILAGAIFGMTARAGQSPATGAPAPKTAAEAYKNIQVLKDIPANELIPTMQFISSSLGVGCDFCHVEHQFQKDDKKPKLIARKMMKMQFAINADDFKGHREVTCNTCHRGSARPMGIPEIAEAGAKPQMPPVGEEKGEAKEPVATPDQVVEAYLHALGTPEAIAKVKSRVEKGNIAFGNREIPVEVYSEAPDKRVSVMHMANGDSVTGFNGTEGWLTFPGRPLEEMDASDRNAAKLDAEFMFPTDVKQLFTQLRVVRPEDVNGHEATVMIGFSEGQPPVKMYFDKESGLLVRMVHFADTALGLNPTQVDFADYRAVDGVQTPYQWTIARPGGRFTIKIDDVQQNVPIDASRFTKPAAPPQASDAH